MDVDRYLKKRISLSFKLDNGSANNVIKKYESFMNMFIIQDQERDELEKFLKEITFGIEIRAQEKIFENAESIHRLMACLLYTSKAKGILPVPLFAIRSNIRSIGINKKE